MGYKKIFWALAIILGVFIFMVLVLAVCSAAPMILKEKSLFIKTVHVGVMTQIMFMVISSVIIICHRNKSRFAINQSVARNFSGRLSVVSFWVSQPSWDSDKFHPVARERCGVIVS